tara:strand:- start:2198 stop:2350 length:153 start_codon:yes stop_codon:yes gene_type:complete
MSTCIYKDKDEYKIDICLPCKKRGEKEVEIIYNEFKCNDIYENEDGSFTI